MVIKSPSSIISTPGKPYSIVIMSLTLEHLGQNSLGIFIITILINNNLLLMTQTKNPTNVGICEIFLRGSYQTKFMPSLV